MTGPQENPERDSSDPSFPIKVDRNVYPLPEHSFRDAWIGLTYADSIPDYPRLPRAPEGSPNILVVLLDDVGYGWYNTFGGLIESPTGDRLAGDGLRYCCFHTTALCAPTRAALLTGRNHHTAATGVVQEMASGFPGYSGIIPRSCATVAELLRQNGYACGWWGKNHNVPDIHTSPAGPFDLWPTRMGFDYFYGFIGGETDNFHPGLYRDTVPVDPPRSPEEGYHLTTDLADDCIAWMRRQKAIAPHRPFFVHFAPVAGHAPHQPPLAWRGRHAGRFDMGWDEYRKQVFRRQLEMGVVPEGTRLTGRPAEIPAWESRPPEERRLYARFAENFADYLEHTDHEVGRLIDALAQLEELENTLVLYILGDNGSSAEGGLTGTLNEMMSLTGTMPDIARILPRIDEIGLPGTSPHYPVGWAWAGDAPFQWTKQVASHFGGTRNGLVASWPRRIADRGGVRFQFHHVIDVFPTILEVVGIAQPTVVNGVHQKPVEGVSMAYSFFKESEAAPSRRRVQYFEMIGHRAIYADGWMASFRHSHLPWKSREHSPTTGKWELYHIAEDFSQSENLAGAYPEKLRELQDLFMVQAARHDVLPLDDRMPERLDVNLRPGFFTGRDKVILHPGMVRLPEGAGPKTNNVDHSISADVWIPETGAEGVLVCLGGQTAGWSLFIRDRRLVYHYNWFDTERYEFVSDAPIPAGEAALRAVFAVEGREPGGPAQVRLVVNGRFCGGGRIEKQVRARFGFESYDVGVDTLSPVSNTYPPGRTGFPFVGGAIRAVSLEFFGVSQDLSPEERIDLMLKMETSFSAW
jgi:arylsulfatase